MAARLTAFLVAIIVGISVVAGLIVGAQREEDPAVDLLVYNGRVYTGDPAAPIAEAVAIRGNRILKIGTNREIKRLRRNAATVIDAHGGSILPGFADTYVVVPGQADAIAGIHRLGLTTVGAVVDDLPAFDALAAVATAADRPIRVAAALKVALPVTELARRDLDARRAQNATGLVRLDALAVDVELPAAKGVRPSPPRRPQPPLLPNDQQESLLELDRAGWPLVLHVDDERELAVALDVVARLIETNTGVAAKRRHRLVLAHAMPLDTARLAILGVTVAMPLPSTWTGVAVEPAPPAVATAAASSATPAPGETSAPAADSVGASTAQAAAVDPAVLPFSFPLPEGVRLVMGSDIVADPRLGLQALVGGALVRATPPSTTAAAPDGTEAAGPGAAARPDPDTAPVERSLLIAALATLTTAAAESLGAPTEWGRLEPGRLADLVVLSADVFELPAAHLLDAVVIATVVDGKVVYDRDIDTPPPTP